ncbi:MAG: DUF6438 domain-containing protein [Bacillota bacterium]|nr:DUF6438 domain-containing protein [Bacillota bacterium]
MFRKVTLERTMCFGDCPVYRIEIDDTGKVIWEGKKYVAKPGRYEWTIPKEKIDELNSAIDKFGYKNYKYNTIDGSKTDFPSVITSVLFDNGYYRKINHYLGDTLEDNRLTEFENEIDRIAGTEDYIHGSSSETMARKASNIFLRYPCCPYYWGISPQFDDRQGGVSSQAINISDIYAVFDCNDYEGFNKVWTERYTRRNNREER